MEMQFLVEGHEVEIASYEGELLGITLPAKVALKITECDPGVRGNTVQKRNKDAVCKLVFVFVFHYLLRKEK